MTISIKECIVYGRYTYNQAQTMDRYRLGFKTAILRRNFRKVSILGQISNCLSNKPFSLHQQRKKPVASQEICASGKASEGPPFDSTS